MKTFKYETQEQKNQLVKEFFGSGKNGEDFCKEKGISKSSLYRWKQKCQITKDRLYFFFLSPKRKKKKKQVQKSVLQRAKFTRTLADRKL